MNIEVTVEGRASITVSQDGSLSPRELDRLASKLHALANSSTAGKASRIGFSSGASLDTEVVDE